MIYNWNASKKTVRFLSLALSLPLEQQQHLNMTGDYQTDDLYIMLGYKCDCVSIIVKWQWPIYYTILYTIQRVQRWGVGEMSTQLISSDAIGLVDDARIQYVRKKNHHLINHWDPLCRQASTAKHRHRHRHLCSVTGLHSIQFKWISYISYVADVRIAIRVRYVRKCVCAKCQSRVNTLKKTKRNEKRA